jgi:hypothetical protein
MEGSVLSFLKAKWKVSDTGSAHCAYGLLEQHTDLVCVAIAQWNNSKFTSIHVAVIRHIILILRQPVIAFIPLMLYD